MAPSHAVALLISKFSAHFWSIFVCDCACCVWLCSVCDCAQCVIVLTVWLCSLCDCAHCVIVLTVWLCSLCVTVLTVCDSAQSVIVLTACDCAHCVWLCSLRVIVLTVCDCARCVWLCSECVIVLTACDCAQSVWLCSLCVIMFAVCDCACIREEIFYKQWWWFAGERGNSVPGGVRPEAGQPRPGHPQLPAVPVRQAAARQPHDLLTAAGRGQNYCSHFLNPVTDNSFVFKPSSTLYTNNNSLCTR